MDFQTINFKDISKEEWNDNIKDLSGHLHLVLWESINYYSAFKNIINKSYLIKHENITIAVVPLAINKNNTKHYFGFNYGYCPSPVFKENIRPSLRRKILNTIITELNKIGKKYKIKNYNAFTHPLVLNRKYEISSKNQFELLSFNPKVKVINTLIMCLNSSENILNENLSKYRKKNIKKSLKKDLKFEIFNGDTEKSVLKKIFKDFKKLHFKSAGKLTRPNKTWRIMFDLILKNKSDLFSLSKANKNISYLYCGKHKNFSWGWSQVNDDKYEKDYMPRHLLEWKTILYYKKLNFEFYEIGERFYFDSKSKISKKQINISEFKEKYGSDNFPKAYFKIKI